MARKFKENLMHGYPPRPSPVLPAEFNPQDWIAQYKYWGWRIVIHNNHAYTRKGNPIPIHINYPLNHEYQLDGEIVNPFKKTEHGVRTAIKDGTFKIFIFDIYLPGLEHMTLMRRLEWLRKRFCIKVPYQKIRSRNHIFELERRAKAKGYEGIVLKRKDSLYKISKYDELLDRNWVKIK